ncbi:MAG: peptidyl-prolyl cis-trans isomerase [Rhizobiaceae bacterium]
MIRRLIREPLVHFLLAGIAVFALYSVTEQNMPTTENEKIEVGPGRIANLKEVFARSRQRPPTQQELEGLVNSFIKEEVNYRESLKLGLDRNDTIIRRRLQQKLEFLMDPSAGELEAADEELEAYLKENSDKYRLPAAYKFQQIYIDPSKRDNPIADAQEMLSLLETNVEAANSDQIGDPTLLPASVGLITENRIAANFGREFAEALADVETGQWTGPIKSTYGVHLLLIDERVDPRDPSLEEARRAVVRDWQIDKRHEISDARYQKLLENYDVEIIWPDREPAGSDGAKTEQQ